jgi:hypothetical protein
MRPVCEPRLQRKPASVDERIAPWAPRAQDDYRVVKLFRPPTIRVSALKEHIPW